MPPKLSEAIALGSFPLDPKAIALNEGGKPKSWVQCAKVGEGFKHLVFGEFDITPTMLDEMERNGNAAQAKVPLDYNHLSFGAVHPDQAIAAGWFEKFERRQNNTELWGLAEWTPKAAKHIQDEEFKYISPLFFRKALDEFGKQVGARLASAALTIYPFLKGMAAISLSELYRLGMVKLIDASNLSIDERKSRVFSAVRDRFELSSEFVWPIDCYNDTVVVERAGKKYSINYKFEDDGSVKLGDELTEVVNNYQPVTALSERGNTMAGNESTSNAEILALKDQITALRGVVDAIKVSGDQSASEAKALREELAQERADRAVSDLIKAGKLLPAQKTAWVNLYKKDHASFVSLSETLQKVVKIESPSGSDEEIDTEKDRTNSDDPERVIALMEQKVKDYIKENGGPDKIRQGDAIKAVANANPELYEKYRFTFVKAGSGNMNVVQ